ncbi:AMP-binding enzyme family protein [Mycobacterium xenopi 4042]|uniref:AMP-binding enzyme family protein n=1 Tax=Mycobacterium xenopi 4042 TaxID=1299334 RepID=X8AGL9_MYCXE|nr:AMP-binding enzyme family protein [Mycobacterium xenopi 4042]
MHTDPEELEGDLLQYSSGTTGRPKGIRRELPHLSPAEAPNMLQPLLTAVGLSGEAVYLSPAPLYHTAPSFWSMSVQSLGGTTVVMETFDAEQALACIQRYRVSHAQFVPAMFVRMLKLPENVRNSYDLSSLRRVVHAAAPCPVEIKKQMIDWWAQSSTSTTPPRRQWEPHLSQPRTGWRIRVRWVDHWSVSRTFSTRTASSCRAARSAKSITRAATPSTTSTTRPRQRRRGTRTAGPPSVISATSTRMVTCT